MRPQAPDMKFGPEVLLIFVGHSEDSDQEAAKLLEIEGDLQRVLEQHQEVANGTLPFKTIRLWEWNRDAFPGVGGQEEIITPIIDRANAAVFLFKERIGAVTWSELERCRNRKDPAISVEAFFSENPPDIGKMKDTTAVAAWLDLLEKKRALTADWTAPGSRSLTPMDDYRDPNHLKSLVLDQLKDVLARLLRIEPTRTGSHVATKTRLPTPPALYAVPNYILTSRFIGRANELDKLDIWAKSADPLMVVEGIGGLGKSALTWEWLQKRAGYAIPGLAGRVWWSFYERGTSMASFVRHALAYITGQDPESFGQESSHYERCQELLVELKRKPYLLVLDGFERVLTAYHRWDKAQQRDDKIEADLRECVEPRDGELLQQLLHCAPSRMILSTRLFPSILENRASSKPIPGVSHHGLGGLSRSDALAFYKDAGIQGSEQAMLDFADEFGYHCLVLKVVCGIINNYQRKPGDFDTWRTDPAYGAKLKLSELDLKQRYNHILHFALEGLEENKRKLLCRIAVMSEGMKYDTIAVLNPFLPPKPAPVDEPIDPEKDSWAWKDNTPAQKQTWLANYKKAQDRFRDYQQALQAHQTAAEQSVRTFDKALHELQDRGLLQWDRESGYFDMHPVVRGHAAEWLEEGDKKQTFRKLRDHFASLPPDDLKKATDISNVAHSLEIFRCLVGEGRLDEAAEFYRGELALTMGDNIGAHTTIVELLSPFFRNKKDGLPNLNSEPHQGYILNYLANATSALHKFAEAMELHVKALRLSLKRAESSEAATCLINYSSCASGVGLRAESVATNALARELAEAAGDHDLVSVAILHQASIAIGKGRFADGERLLLEFHSKPLPSAYEYTPGEAEYWSCLSQFCQGMLIESELIRCYELTVIHRDVLFQRQNLSLRSIWLLLQDLPKPALEAIDDALKIANRLGTPVPEYHDLRAWALASLGRGPDARAELANGEQRRYAAEAWLILGDREQARTCALKGYEWAWGEGPPYIEWYELERSKAILKELGEPEPQLPPFDPSTVKPIPYEKEIRAAIAKLNAEKEARAKKGGATS